MKKVLNIFIIFLAVILFGLVLTNGIYELIHISNITYYEAVAATCTEDGNVEYWYDSGSCKYYSDEACTQELESVVIEATGHNYDRSGTCAVCGSEIEGLNAWYSDTVLLFTYNGLTLDDHTIYYLTDEDSCYYLEYGVKYYIYTAEDIENGLQPMVKSASASGSIPKKWACMSGHFGIGICWSDDGGVYSLWNIRTPHTDGGDGVCTLCGETIS